AAGGDPIALWRYRQCRDGADRAAQRLAQRTARLIEQEQFSNGLGGWLIACCAVHDERAVGRHREILDTRWPERRERTLFGGAIEVRTQQALLDALAVNGDHVGVRSRRNAGFLADGLCCEQEQTERGGYQTEYQGHGGNSAAATCLDAIRRD